MRRRCVWCGEYWDASAVEPPMTEPYFCPLCDGRQALWDKLRKNEGDAYGIPSARQKDRR